MDHAGSGDVQCAGLYRISLPIYGHAALPLQGIMDLIAGVGVSMRRDDRMKFLYTHVHGFDQ